MTVTKRKANASNTLSSVPAVSPVATQVAIEPIAVSIPVFAGLVGIRKSLAYDYVRAGLVPTVKIGSDQKVTMEVARRVGREGLPRLPKRTREAA